MTDVVAELSGVLYDKLSRTQRPVHLKVRGHVMEIAPPDGGEKPPQPPTGIWPGPGDPDWGPGDGKPPQPPGVIWPKPGDPDYPIKPIDPPDVPKPQPPAPGSPTTAVPGNWPVNPITPPPYMIVNYPGIGPVVVAPPAAPTQS